MNTTEEPKNNLRGIIPSEFAPHLHRLMARLARRKAEGMNTNVECPKCGGYGEIWTMFNSWTCCDLCNDEGEVSEETAVAFLAEQEPRRADRRNEELRQQDDDKGRESAG